MKNTFKRIGMATSAVLVAIMSVPFMGIFRNAMAGNDGYVDFSDTAITANGVDLYKTVQATGQVNEWDVTLKVVSPKAYKTTDTVIVIDRSSSMASKLDTVKSLAKTMVSHLLKDATANKVSVVTFGDGSLQSWTDNATALSSAIDLLVDANTNDGAFTQQGLNEAVRLLSGSSAEYKNIVLISDSVPNYSYNLTNSANSERLAITQCSEKATGTTNILIGGVNVEYENWETVPHKNDCLFGDSIRPDSSSTTPYEFRADYPTKRAYYYNHGNAAIAAVKNFKAGANNTVTTISLDGTSDEAIKVLKDIASDSNNYFTLDSNNYGTATPILNDVYEKKNNSAYAAAVNAKVFDQVNAGFTVLPGGNYTVNGNKVEWTPNLDCGDTNTTICTDQVIYRVQINDAIASATADSNGFYELSSTNGAVMNYEYNGTAVNDHFFPVVKLNPVLVTIEKELIGQNCAECTFDIRLVNGASVISKTVKAGVSNKVTLAEVFQTAGEYIIEEYGTNVSNSVKLENYFTSFSDEKITIAADGKDYSVKVTNKYEEVEVKATKIWDDASDQDGVRKDEDFYFVVKDNNGVIVTYRAIDITVDTKDYTVSLPRWLNNTELTYTIEEMINCQTNSGVNVCDPLTMNASSKYAMDRVGDVFTNSHTPETINIAVNKTWNDDNNRDGLRNINTAVRFCVEGSVGGTSIIDKCSDDLGVGLGTLVGLQDNALIEFKDLPKYFNKGMEIQYEVREDMSLFAGKYMSVIPAGYLTITNNSGSLDVENTHTPEKRDIQVTIEWNDDDDSDSLRPSSVEVELSGGATHKTVIIDKSGDGTCGDWCATFKDEFTNAGGKEIQYTVAQTTVPAQYNEGVSGDMMNGFVIKNTHVPNFPLPNPDPNDNGGKGGIKPTLSPDTGAVTANKSAAENNVVMATMATASMIVIGLFAITAKFAKTISKK